MNKRPSSEAVLAVSSLGLASLVRSASAFLLPSRFSQPSGLHLHPSLQNGPALRHAHLLLAQFVLQPHPTAAFPLLTERFIAGLMKVPSQDSGVWVPIQQHYLLSFVF